MVISLQSIVFLWYSWVQQCERRSVIFFLLLQGFCFPQKPSFLFLSLIVCEIGKYAYFFKIYVFVFFTQIKYFDIPFCQLNSGLANVCPLFYYDKIRDFIVIVSEIRRNSFGSPGLAAERFTLMHHINIEYRNAININKSKITINKIQYKNIYFPMQSTVCWMKKSYEQYSNTILLSET